MNTDELAALGIMLAEKLEMLAESFHVKSDAHDFLLWEAAIIKAKLEDLLTQCGVASNLQKSILLSVDHQSLRVQYFWIERVRFFHTEYIRHKALSVLSCLINDYQQGLYLPGEVVCKSIDVLVDSDSKNALWQAIPQWVQQEIINRLCQPFEDEARVSINSPYSSNVMTQRMTILKNWLIEEGIMH